MWCLPEVIHDPYHEQTVVTILSALSLFRRILLHMHFPRRKPQKWLAKTATGEMYVSAAHHDMAALISVQLNGEYALEIHCMADRKYALKIDCMADVLIKERGYFNCSTRACFLVHRSPSTLNMISM